MQICTVNMLCIRIYAFKILSYWLLLLWILWAEHWLVEWFKCSCGLHAVILSVQITTVIGLCIRKTKESVAKELL